MSHKSSLQVAALKRARDLAGGVSYLARKLGIGVNSLDDMLHDKEPVPSWVFVRAVDFINEAETTGATPPGFPEDWQQRWLDGSTWL
jgi:hypothetical protein